MIDLNATGIYAIVNVASSKVYVGSTGASFRRRWSGHRSALQGGRHGNSHLQRSWDKYGNAAFEFIILEYVDSLNVLIDREQCWLDELRMICEVYNNGPVAASPSLGTSPSEEARAKMSRAHKGRKFSKEHRRKIGEANKRRVWSEESKRKNSEARKGERNPNYGTHLCEETRRKISEALKGRKFSKEHKAKLSKQRARPYPAFIHRETSEVIPAGINLQAMCQKRGFDRANMCAVIHGRSSHCKGWALLRVRNDG